MLPLPPLLQAYQEKRLFPESGPSEDVQCFAHGAERAPAHEV